MPEISVDEHRDFVTLQYEVWTADHILRIASKLDPRGSENRRQQNFRRGPLRSHRGHDARTRLSIEDVG